MSEKQNRTEAKVLEWHRWADWRTRNLEACFLNNTRQSIWHVFAEVNASRFKRTFILSCYWGNKAQTWRVLLLLVTFLCHPLHLWVQTPRSAKRERCHSVSVKSLKVNERFQVAPLTFSLISDIYRLYTRRCVQVHASTWWLFIHFFIAFHSHDTFFFFSFWYTPALLLFWGWKLGPDFNIW